MTDEPTEDQKKALDELVAEGQADGDYSIPIPSGDESISTTLDGSKLWTPNVSVGPSGDNTIYTPTPAESVETLSEALEEGLAIIINESGLDPADLEAMTEEDFEEAIEELLGEDEDPIDNKILKAMARMLRKSKHNTITQYEAEQMLLNDHALLELYKNMKTWH